MELTTLETQLIKVLIQDEMNGCNGGNNGFQDISIEWASTDVDTGFWAKQMSISTSACKGVLSSLVKKNIIVIFDDGFEWKEEAFEEFKKLGW